MKVALIVFFLFLSFNSAFTANDSPLFTVGTPNNGSFQVFEKLNTTGDHNGYFSKIVVPVCEEGVCYDVNITFYWDLIGSFLRFETTPKEPLTKLDHVPFTTKDYDKLQDILTNHDLVFTGMPAEKLVSKTEMKGLDAMSGATVSTIKKEVIAGALFTCHSLWHIANGVVVDSIRNYTKKELRKSIIESIAQINNPKANYYLIENLNEEQFSQNLPLLFTLIKKSEGYFPKNAFESFPLKLYETANLQLFIAKEYANFPYHTRVAILKKLQLIKKADPLLLHLLLTQLGERNSSENLMITELILLQGNLNLWNELASKENLSLSEAHRSRLNLLLSQ
jgi:hypothetical protein